MSAPRIVLIGLGRMGRVVEELARERGVPVVARLTRRDFERGTLAPEAIVDAEVAVEFTTPESAAANVIACANAGIPVVSGTTGWMENLPHVIAEVERLGGALLWSPNFAIGVNLLWEIAEVLSGRMARISAFDAHIVETHHTAKRDAPSGTAAELARRASTALGRPVPITSVRVGHVPGTHEIVFDGPFEQVRLEHVARDRRVFAEGALTAAAWLAGRRGIFTMRDLLADGGDGCPRNA